MAQNIMTLDGNKEEISAPVREVLSKAFVWMLGGMILAAIGALAVGRFEFLRNWAISNPVISLILLGVWFVFSIGFRPLVKAVPAPVGAVLFVIYTLATGIFLTVVINQYTTASLVIAFVATVVLFGSMTLFALVTKMDLLKTRFYVWAAGFAIVVFAVINAVFFRSELLDWLISLGLLILFTVSTGSSIQTIAQMAEENDPKLRDRLVILSAATLFTNFIMIFLRILRLFGQRKR